MHGVAIIAADTAIALSKFIFMIGVSLSYPNGNPIGGLMVPAGEPTPS
jgi:hypothetical protein